jgi:predicted phage terminase large subunit-like protein
VWSVFTHRGAPRVMLAEAWRDRLELRALCERLMDTCRRRQADMMLIENKASGPSVQQEMRRLMRDGEFQLRLENIKGDKSSRLHAVVPMFSGGIVYAPDRKWADLVIDEVASVPKGAHDDLADTVSMALGYLRRTGMARLTTEYERDVIDLMTFKGSSSRSNSVAERYGV